MKDGEIVEQGSNKKIFNSPKEDYTKALLSVIIDNTKRLKVLPTVESYDKKKKTIAETKNERKKKNR